MLYLVLSIVLFLLAGIFYFKYKADILSISVLTALVYGVSSLGAFMATATNSWNYQQLHPMTAGIIILGVTALYFGEKFSRKLRFKISNKDKTIDLENYEHKPIRIDFLKTLICILFVIITILLIFTNMKQLTGESSISTVINSYRSSSEIFNNEAAIQNIKINTLYMIMYRMCEIIGLIYIYIIIRNKLAKYKNNPSSIILIILCILLTFLLSGRSGFMRYLIEALVIWLILYRKKKPLKIVKFVRIMIKAAIIILPLFYLILPLLGRSTSATWWDYLSFYVGSPIASFDVLIEKGLAHSQNFGALTLKGMQGILSKIGLYNSYSNYASKWVYFKTGLSSNVFTSMYAPFVDFGLSGVIICQFLFGYIFTKLYLNAKENINVRYLLIYAFFANLIIDQFRSEKLFTSFFSYNTLIYLILIIIISFLILGNKVIKKGQ